MEILIQEFLKLVRKNKLLFRLTLLVFLTFLFKKYLFDSGLIMARQSYLLIKDYLHAVIFLAITLSTTIFLLIKSDREFRKLEKEHYKGYENHVSKEKVPIGVQVYEYYDKANGQTNKYREINIINGLEEKIDYIKGKVEFYDDRTRIFTVSFEIEDLEVLRKHRIHYGEIKKSEKVWNEFNTKVDEMKAGKYSKKNLLLHGVCFHRTYYLILNKYNYIRFGKFKILYEISWLRDIIRRKLFWRMKWHFRLRNIKGNISLTQYYYDLLKNITRIVLSLPFIILGILLVGYLIIESTVFLYKLISIWISGVSVLILSNDI